MPEYDPPVTFEEARNFTWHFERETDYGRIVFQIDETMDRRISVGPDDNVIKLDAPAYPNRDRSAGRANKDRKGTAPENSALDWVRNNFKLTGELPWLNT